MSKFLNNTTKRLVSNSFEKFPNDNFSLIKEIIMKHENPKKEKKSIFACFSKPKKKNIIDFDKINIRTEIFEFRKIISTFCKTFQNLLVNEQISDYFFNFTEVANSFTSLSCEIKIKQIFKRQGIENKLKDEVDKYAQFFNAIKIAQKQRRKIKSQNQKLLILEDAKMSNDCIICMESDRNVVFYPCLHLICCEVCVSTKIQQNCPQCFQKIDNKLIL
jgi:hypothetical protein